MCVCNLYAPKKDICKDCGVQWISRIGAGIHKPRISNLMPWQLSSCSRKETQARASQLPDSANMNSWCNIYTTVSQMQVPVRLGTPGCCYTGNLEDRENDRCQSAGNSSEIVIDSTPTMKGDRGLHCWILWNTVVPLKSLGTFQKREFDHWKALENRLPKDMRQTASSKWKAYRNQSGLCLRMPQVKYARLTTKYSQRSETEKST